MSDIGISLIIISILILPCIFIWIAVKLTSKGPGLYWSRRIGYKSKFFMMPKFRTMILDTPEIESNQLLDPKKYVTPFGFFLRKTSLDEIPQFFSVLIGDMSVVGPRPALHNQYKLIAKRKQFRIDILRPGITGWAQINGRDKLLPSRKIYLDLQYLNQRSILFDFKIILKTILLVITLKNINH